VEPVDALETERDHERDQEQDDLTRAKRTDGLEESHDSLLPADILLKGELGAKEPAVRYS